MRARWILNLLLLILVAVLSAAVRRELDRAQWIQTLTELKPVQITEIELERPSEPIIQLQRGEEGWRMVSPYRVVADADRIGELLEIAHTRVHRTLPEGAGAQRLGLEPGRIRLVFDGVELRFGDLEPIGQRRYAAAGGQIHLIEDGFHHHLIAPVEDYVSRSLLPSGFIPGAGMLDGEGLGAPELEELGGLLAERVMPMAEEISGRLVSLRDLEKGLELRFLVSADARRWTRLDLRLAYLLSDPPFWAVTEEDAPFAPARHSEGQGRAGEAPGA